FVTASTTDIGTKGLHPPFNQFSKFRDPGKLNLNTIPAKEVFQGLMAGYPDYATDAAWGAFKNSRDGSGGNQSFGGPFRSPNAGDMVPVSSLKQYGVDCTVLRRNPLDNTKPLYDSNNQTDYRNTDRNAFFHHQAIARLGNLTTTRSN